jgi:hypothetical protein
MFSNIFIYSSGTHLEAPVAMDIEELVIEEAVDAGVPPIAENITNDQAAFDAGQFVQVALENLLSEEDQSILADNSATVEIELEVSHHFKRPKIHSLIMQRPRRQR